MVRGVRVNELGGGTFRVGPAADLAVATLSLGWNYPGRPWEAEFFAAYGG